MSLGGFGTAIPPSAAKNPRRPPGGNPMTPNTLTLPGGVVLLTQTPPVP